MGKTPNNPLQRTRRMRRAAEGGVEPRFTGLLLADSFR